MMRAAPCADAPRLLDAISLYHQLRYAHDGGAPLSTYEEEILALIQSVLEPVRGDGALSWRDVVRLPTNRRVTIAADHRLLRGRVVRRGRGPRTRIALVPPPVVDGNDARE